MKQFALNEAAGRVEACAVLSQAFGGPRIEASATVGTAG